jgi:hypothetical protein
MEGSGTAHANREQGREVVVPNLRAHARAVSWVTNPAVPRMRKKAGW